MNISWRAARRAPKSSDWRKGRIAESREGGRRIGREERGGGVGGTKKQEERGVVLDEVEEERGRRKDDAI